MGQLPPLALEFAKKLCSEVGGCGEVFLTAYTIYAQCVEEIPCDDSLYQATPMDAKWFSERLARTSCINIRDVPSGWEGDDSYVYIGRAGKGHDGYFGNPIRLKWGAPRGATIQKFREYFLKRISEDAEFKERILSLRGKTMVCFCKPQPCHGDVIVEFLRGQES